MKLSLPSPSSPHALAFSHMHIQKQNQIHKLFNITCHTMLGSSYDI